MWKVQKFGELVVSKGTGLERKASLQSAEKQFRYLKMNNITRENQLDMTVLTSVDASSDEVEKYSLDNGDFLFNTRNSVELVGKSAVYQGDDKILFNNNILRVKFTESVDSRYVNYFLTSSKSKNALEKIKTGTTNVAAIYYKDLKNFKILLPPLEEQKAIVAKLDTAFAEIDKAIAVAERNAENAKAIYAFAINAAFTQHKELNDKLGKHAEINYGYTAKASFETEGHYLLRITDIQDGNVNWDTVPRCIVEEKKLPKVLLKDGDIVFARTGATTGKSFLLSNPINSVFASYLIRADVDRSKFLPEFVYHYFQSETYWQQVEKGISGAAQGGFNASKLAELKIPLIPISEQKHIVKQLDEIRGNSNLLKEIYQRKLDALLTLRGNLLNHVLVKDRKVA